MKGLSIVQQYLPPLSTIIPVENIPSGLGAIQGGLVSIFSDLYFKDLQVDGSASGDEAFYHLTIVVLKKIGIEIPGTGGMALVLNPDFTDGTASEFKVFAGYKWRILKYLRDFDLSGFDFSPKAFYDLLLVVSGANDSHVLKRVVDLFFAELDDDATDPIQRFVDDFNARHTPPTPLVITPDPDELVVLEDILVQFVTNGNNFDFVEIIFVDYIDPNDDFGDVVAKVERLFSAFLGDFSLDGLEALLMPRAYAALDALTLAIEFPRSIFQPLLADGTINPDEQVKSYLSFDVDGISYSTEAGFEFENESSFSFTKSAILNSDFTLELHDLKLDLSRTENIPEAIADGRPEDFVGVYVKDGTLSFPAAWNHDPASTGAIKARRLLIGTGGFSGSLALEALTAGDPAPLIKLKFGDDFSISLDAFSITFKQNAITDSAIEGTLVIPGFKDANNNLAEIRIKVAIRQNGDFDITAHEDQGFKTFKCGDIFDLTLKSVFFGERDGDFYLGVSGTIKFTQNLLSGLAPVEVEKLLIWSDGRFEIEGGTIPLPKNIRFPIGPAELSISAIHLGSHQQINSNGTTRNFRYFGFDGGVDVNPGGVDVRGKGIKFYFPVDLVLADCYLEIKSIAIDLVIPGSASKETATVLISGYLSIGGTQADPEYEGGISFALPKVKIAGGASMKMRPKVPAFIVDAFVELSTPIPLGATGLGIYGFRGLFGQRYVATKHAAGLQETDTWFDYYKVKDPNTQLEGVSVSKFEGPSLTKSYDSAFSIGAGVSLATAQDGGKTFSCKLFLLLSLPDVIYLEGKANILGERVGLIGEDPPFFAMLAISSQSVETGIGVDYKLPRDGAKKGWILDMNAEMRAAFFFQNSSAWYINFGTIDNPTTARVLTIFDATSYVMLSAAGIAAGAGVTYEFSKSYAGGMVHASVGVYIKVGGFISFERPQIGGFAMLGGHVDVSLMFFSFYLVIDTSLSVEVPKPFYIQGSVHLCVGVTIGFWKFKKHIEKCFDVEFKWEKDSTVDTTPVLPFADLANPSVPSPIMGTNMLSGESFNIVYLGTSPPSAPAASFDQAVVPLDSWIDLEFLKGLLPGPDVDVRIGRLSGQAPANTIDYVPPAEVPHKVKHEYAIKAVEIQAWNGSAWVEYRPYEAMSPPDALATLNADPSAYKDGFWQNTGAGFSKVRLLAETSLSYMQQGQPGWYVPEQFGITSATLFCRTKLRENHCLRWTEVLPATQYPADAWRQSDTVLFCVSGGPGTVIDWNSPFGILRSLAFANEATSQIVFSKPCVEVNLKLTTFSSGAVIKFFKRETAGAGFLYTPVETRTLTQLQLLAPVQYTNPAVPVTKVEIDPVNAGPAAISALQIQLDALNRQLIETKLDGDAKATLAKKIRALELDLAGLKGRGCVPKGFDKEALIQQLAVLERQVEDCRKQLSALAAEQQKTCSEAAKFRALFERCFPQTPSMLSHEVVKEQTATKSTGYRFVVYDDLTDSVLLNGTKQFPSSAEAVSAMNDTLALALRPEAYALMTNKDSTQYFFQIVGASRDVRAVSPAIFKTAIQRNAFVAQTQAALRAAQAGGKFVLAQRLAGKLPCDESFDHLACWSELPALGAVAQDKCNTILTGILSARDAFCNQYNRLYREFYACNKKLLDAATLQCEELTRKLIIKRKECQALNDQLTAIKQLIGSIDKNGALQPPEKLPCSTLLHEACCLSLEDYQFNLSAPGQAAIEQDYENAVQGIEKMLTPIWRPDTKYSIHLQVTDTVNDVASLDSDFYFGFRTAGPVGYFHTDVSANYVIAPKTPDLYMLTSLKGYVDYRRSYPDPSGQLIGAKPLFYEDARILLFFTKRYVYHFFGDWPAYNGLPALTGNAMQIIIKDPAENTSIPNPPPPQITTTEIPQAVVSWPTDDDPRIPEDIRTLLNLRNPELLNPDFAGGDCWSSGGDMITPASVYAQVIPQYLKPLKLYTAVVNNVYLGQIREVLQYVFQTSRYPDFPAQINSYRLDDGKGNQRDAVFRINLALTVASIGLMYDVVAGNMSAPNAALAGTWADPFDRLVEGVMKLAPLDAAVSTEFNMVRNSSTNAVVAILIRNPESFNDPKLPDDVTERSLRVMNGLNPDLSYKMLFSKDRSQVFIMHPSKTIPVTQLKIRFAYIEWDGSDYVDHTVVVSGVIPTNV